VSEDKTCYKVLCWFVRSTINLKSKQRWFSRSWKRLPIEDSNRWRIPINKNVEWSVTAWSAIMWATEKSKNQECYIEAGDGRPLMPVLIGDKFVRNRLEPLAGRDFQMEFRRGWCIWWWRSEIRNLDWDKDCEEWKGLFFTFHLKLILFLNGVSLKGAKVMHFNGRYECNKF